MQFIIEKNIFLKLLSHANNVVERRNTLLILANILIEAKDDRVRITATDMEMEVVEEAPANVIKSGKTTVSAAIIHDYVGKLDDGAQIEVAFDEEKERLSLKSGKSVLEQATMAADEFPVMDATGFTHEFSLEAHPLRSMFNRAKFAMSQEETRFYLNGIYIHDLIEGEEMPKLRFVATDGHRMARLEMPLPDGAKGMPAIIVPRKTVNDFIRLTEDDEGMVHIRVGENKIRFEIGDLILTSKLVDGRYPEYDRVIPKTHNSILAVDQRELRNALNRVSIVSAERAKTVKMMLSNNIARISAVTDGPNSADDEINVEYDAQELTIGFNSRYMSEIMANIIADKANIYLQDGFEPMLIRDDGDESALFLLMPLRV